MYCFGVLDLKTKETNQHASEKDLATASLGDNERQDAAKVT